MDQRIAEQRAYAAILDTLRRARLFSGVPEEAIESLARVSALKTYQDGECIVSYGQPGQGLVVIASGCIVTSRTNARGKRLIFDLGQPGQIMGSFAAFDGEPSPLDNHARGETNVVIVPYEHFRAAVRHYPDLAVGLIAMHTRRNRLDFERMMAVLDPMRIRVAKVLLYLARGSEVPKGRMHLPVRISQADIASILGVTRPSANKELVAMARKGILAWRYSDVVVPDMKKLIAVVVEGKTLSSDFERALFNRSPEHFRTSD